MKKLKSIMLLSILTIVSFGYVNAAFEGQEYIENVNFADDGTISTEDVTVGDNNVDTGETQVTGDKTTTPDTSVNLGAPTDIEPINSSTNANGSLNSSTSLNSSSELNSTSTNDVKVKELPATGPEAILLLIISLLITGFVFFRSKIVKI